MSFSWTSSKQMDPVLERVKAWLNSPPNTQPMLYVADIRILVEAFEELKDDFYELNQSYSDAITD